MERPGYRHSWDDYLLVESSSQTRHDYLEGCIYAVPRAGALTAQLTVRVMVALRAARELRGEEVHLFGPDLRVFVEATGYATWPTLSAVVGEVNARPEPRGDIETLLNPTVVIEVLDDATGAWKREGKFRHYRSIASLREYVLVSHREPLIEVFTRPQSGDSWLRAEARSGAVPLRSLGLSLSVDEVYAGVEL